MAGARRACSVCLRCCLVALVVCGASAAATEAASCAPEGEGSGPVDASSLLATRSAQASNASAAEVRGTACVGQTGWDTRFNDHLYECGLRTGFAMPAVGRCLTRRQGVSQACGDCMGRLVVCGFPCASACCSGTCRFSDSCWACNERKCNPEFAQCAGVYPPHH